VAVSEDRNRKCRKTMEDSHTFIYNYGDHCDDGYFAVFDGHAGHVCAEWCSKQVHSLVEAWIKANEKAKMKDPVPHALSSAFREVDTHLARMNMQSSGCCAAVAIVRWEPFIYQGNTTKRRVLYAANVGDTRVVLCRAGKAYRLTYDHKGSDEHESKRITNLGGIMINNRVNGVLAVTRSLGDTYMKELVTGAPYTTETVLRHDDEFIIVACDGLWDVCNDSTAVELIRHIKDPKEASQTLVDYALENFSTDNLTCMVIRLNQDAVSPNGHICQQETNTAAGRLEGYQSDKADIEHVEMDQMGGGESIVSH
jgi:protein phosphatase PTC1